MSALIFVLLAVLLLAFISLRQPVAVTVRVQSTPPPVSRISLRDTGTNGSFAIAVDGVEWFAPGRPISVRHLGRSFTAADGTLRLVARGEATGTDALGPFARRWWKWSAADLSFETAVRTYTQFAVFEQSWLTAASRCSGGPLTSTLPSLALPEAGAVPRRGFLAYMTATKAGSSITSVSGDEARASEAAWPALRLCASLRPTTALSERASCCRRCLASCRRASTTTGGRCPTACSGP